MRSTVKTTKGRVVYDRKKHEFSIADILRIMKKKNAELGIISVNKDAWSVMLDCILKIPAEGSGTDPIIPNFEFSGGTSGGGGASGEFEGTPLYTADYVVLVKK